MDMLPNKKSTYETRVKKCVQNKANYDQLTVSNMLAIGCLLKSSDHYSLLISIGYVCLRELMAVKKLFM